jgi:hypothetical protein
VVGHFDDAAARTCLVDDLPGETAPPELIVLSCRTFFVVTDVTPVAGSQPNPDGLARKEAGARAKHRWFRHERGGRPRSERHQRCEQRGASGRAKPVELLSPPIDKRDPALLVPKAHEHGIAERRRLQLELD